MTTDGDVLAETGGQPDRRLIIEQGKEAGRRDEPVTANPYDAGTLARLHWLEGWSRSFGRRRR